MGKDKASARQTRRGGGGLPDRDAAGGGRAKARRLEDVDLRLDVQGEKSLQAAPRARSQRETAKNPYSIGQEVHGQDCGGCYFHGVVTRRTSHSVLMDGTHWTPLSLIRGEGRGADWERRDAECRADEMRLRCAADAEEVLLRGRIPKVAGGVSGESGGAAPEQRAGGSEKKGGQTSFSF